MASSRWGAGRRRRVAIGVMTAVGLLAISPPSAAATDECTYFGNCTPVTGPWVSVPAGQPDEPGTAGYQLTCPPNNSLALGFDATKSAAALFVGVFPYSSGLPPFGQTFSASNLQTVPVTFQPVIGCVTGVAGPSASSVAALGTSPATVRVREVALQPSRRVSVRHGCASGERLRRSDAGVGFFTQRRPSRQELRQVRVSRRVRGGRVVLAVRTGRNVGDNERVTAQVLAHCSR